MYIGKERFDTIIAIKIIARFYTKNIKIKEPWPLWVRICSGLDRKYSKFDVTYI